MFPYKIEGLDPSLNRQLMDDFSGERTGFCQVGPQKWLLPAAYADKAEKFYSLPLRKDDVWVMTYPRSGTTWTQELVWLLMNDFDYDTAFKVPMDTRFPFYEFSILHHEKYHEELILKNEGRQEVVNQLAYWRRPGYEWAREMPSPRLLKTHLPFSLLPPGLDVTARVIYVARNPKDVAVSYYHHNKLLKLHGYSGDFDKYWSYFENNLLVYSPYWEHIMEGWSRKDHSNVLFLFYEDMLNDLPGNIRKIAKFLDKPITDDQLEKLRKHLQIDNFRKAVTVHKDIGIKGAYNDSAESFIRKGTSGGHKEYTPELEKRVNDWIENRLSTTDLRFPQVKKK